MPPLEETLIVSSRITKNGKDGSKSEINALGCNLQETKMFRMNLENKIYFETVTSKCCSPDTNGLSQGFFVDILTKRISQLEKEHMKKNTNIKYWSNQTTSSINN